MLKVALFLFIGGLIYLFIDLGRGANSPAVVIILTSLLLFIIAPFIRRDTAQPGFTAGKNITHRGVYALLALLSFAVILLGLADVFFSIFTDGFDTFIWLYIFPVAILLCIIFSIASWRSRA